MGLVAESIQVKTDDGVLLHVETVGEGPPMLLCNGLFCSTHYWPDFVAHFAKTHRVITFDYRGHGRSAAAVNPSRTNLNNLTDDALSVLDVCTREPAVIVGHSMGLRVAAEIAVRRPEQVRANIFVCGTAWMLGDHPLHRAAERLAGGTLTAASKLGPFARAIRHVTTEPSLLWAAAGLVGGMGEQTPKEPVEGLVRNIRNLDIQLMASIARAYLSHDARPLLPKISQPTLQLVGALDRLASESHAAEIAKMMPKITTSVLPGCTHLAPVEYPERVHEAIHRFFEHSLSQ